MTQRSAPRILLLLCIAASLAVVLGEPAGAAPAIMANPTSGLAGVTSVTVSATAFTPFEPCEVRFDGIRVSTPSCQANKGGAFVVTFTVSAKAQPGSGQRILACTSCDTEFDQRLTTAFTVNSPPTTTTATTSASTTVASTSTTAKPTTTAPPATASTTTVAVTTPTEPTTTVDPTTTSTTTTALPTVTGDIQLLDSPIIDETQTRIGSGVFGAPHTVVAGPATATFAGTIVPRCAAPPRAQVTTFEWERVGTPASDSLRARDRTATVVVEPATGTQSGDQALQLPRLERPTVFWFEPGSVRYFGVHVGFPEGSPTARAVRLQAYGYEDADPLRTIKVVDVDAVALSAEPGAITNCMIVQVPPGHSVSRVYIETVGAAPVLAIDDVFFGYEPYPYLESIRSVDLSIAMPREGQRIDAARPVTVAGTAVYPQGLALDRVEVTLPAPGGGITRRTATLGGGLLRRDGRQAAIFVLDGVVLPPGTWTVTAAAYGMSLHGRDTARFEVTGAPVLGDEDYRTTIAGDVDIRPWAIEVTQAVHGPLAIQEPDTATRSDAKLVAGKKTVVRGYAVQRFPSGAPDRLQMVRAYAQLRARRGGVDLVGSPIAATSPFADVPGGEPGIELERSQRSSMRSSWNFEIPEQWTAAGDVEFELEVNPTRSLLPVSEARGTNGAANRIRQTATFATVPAPHIFPIGIDYSYQCTADFLTAWWSDCQGRAVGDVVTVPAPTVHATVASLAGWWKMVPLPGNGPGGVSMSNLKIAAPGTPGPLNEPLLSGAWTVVDHGTAAGAFRDVLCTGPRRSDWDRFWDPDDILRLGDYRSISYFLTPDRITVTGGCAWVATPSVFRTSLHSPTLAQEAGHTLGLRHTSDAHGESSGGTAIDRWDGDHGQLGRWERPVFGFDTELMVPVAPSFSSVSHPHDYMSYGGGREWTSIETWNHAFEVFVQNRALGDSRSGVLAGSSGADASSGTGTGTGTPAENLARQDATASTPAPEVLVVKAAIAASGEARIGAVRLGSGVRGDRNSATARRVEARAADGTVLGVADAFAIGNPAHEAASADEYLVAELPAALTADPRLVSLVLVADGRDAATVAATTGAAPVQVADAEDVIAGLAARQPVDLRWLATPGATASVEASRDGTAWYPLGASAEGLLRIDPSSGGLSGAGWMLRVQASDGVRVTSGTVGPIDFGVGPPRATIMNPATANRPVGPVALRAARSSVGDDGTTFTWSLDGVEAGSGDVFETLLAEPGRHVVTLVAANAAGTDEATWQVDVGFDDDGDGLVDDWERSGGLSPDDPTDALSDGDGDGLDATDEHARGTAPNAADSDSDDYADGIEIQGGADPLDAASRPAGLHGEPGRAALRLSEGGGVTTSTTAAGPNPADANQGPSWLAVGVAAASATLLAAVAAGWIVRRRNSRRRLDPSRPS